MPIQLSSSNIIINDNGLNECGFLINNTVNNFAPNTSIGDLIIDCDAGKCIHFKTGSSIIPVALTITTSNIGVGTTAPKSNFHIHAGTVQDIRMQLTDSGTGATITDGFILRKDTAHNGYLWNHEPNSSLIFGTNNLERLRISNTGAISTNNNSINAGTATITAATFSGNLSGNATSATSATNAQGLTGTPSITVNAITANSINGATINGGNLSGSMYREAPFLYHLYRDSHWGTGSRFIIQTNLLFNEYSRPNLQWRWIIGISTGDTLGWAWGFFCGIYDQYRNAFAVQAIYGGQNITISQNWDAWGGNRCIIDINVSNAHNYINLNIY